MKKVILLLSVIIIASMQDITLAQHSSGTNSIFYHSIRAPQSLDENPALFPTTTNFYLTLPEVGLSFNSPLSISDLLTHNPGDTVTYIDLDKISSNLSKNNKLRLDLDLHVLGFGFRIGNTFANASVKVKLNGQIGIPNDAINFLTSGNVDDNGNPINEVKIVDGDLFNLQAYTESAIGVGHIFPELGLTVGGKFKMYNGLANISTANTHISLETDPNMDDMTVKAYYELNVASIAQIDPNDTVNPVRIPSVSEALMLKSMGFGIDLGAKYKLGPVTLSASLLDLSQGIHWTQNTYQVAPAGGEQSFSFSGLDFESSGLLNNQGMNFDTIINYFSSRVDSLKNYQFTESEGYWYSIPTKVNLGASISFLRICRAGILLHGQWDKGLITTKKALDRNDQNFRFNTTLSASVNLKNWVELTVANGFVSDSKNFTILNPGLGLILAPATAVQIYVMADYVSSIYLVEAKAFKLQLGLNLIFGAGEGKKILKNAL